MPVISQKALLCRAIIVVFVSLSIPTLVLMGISNQSAILWRLNAVRTNGVIKTVETIMKKYVEQCDSKCVGHCNTCYVAYYNIYVTLEYCGGHYRYPVYQQDHPKDYVHRGTLQFKVGNNISMYYDKRAPNSAHLELPSITLDIWAMMVAVLFACLIAIWLFVNTRPGPEDVPRKKSVTIESPAPPTLPVSEPSAPLVDIVTELEVGTYYQPVINNEFELQPLYVSTNNNMR